MPLSVDRQLIAHATNISNIISQNEMIISGADDGVVKIWNKDLKQIGEIQAPGGVLSIAADKNILYTCTSDETLQAWDLQTFTNIKQIKSSLLQPTKIYCEAVTGQLWAGNSVGNVAKYENGEETALYELVEEIWDLIVCNDPTCIFTARDRDIVVCEITVSGNRTRVNVRKTLCGRSPMCITSKYLCFLDRDGKNICVCDNSLENKFPKLAEIPASEFIINALSSSGGSDNLVFSGGYDNCVKLWNLEEKKCVSELNVNTVVNSLCSPSRDQVFVACSNGLIMKLVNK